MQSDTRCQLIVVYDRMALHVCQYQCSSCAVPMAHSCRGPSSWQHQILQCVMQCGILSTTCPMSWMIMKIICGRKSCEYQAHFIEIHSLLSRKTERYCFGAFFSTYEFFNSNDLTVALSCLFCGLCFFFVMPSLWSFSILVYSTCSWRVLMICDKKCSH